MNTNTKKTSESRTQSPSNTADLSANFSLETKLEQFYQKLEDLIN